MRDKSPSDLKSLILHSGRKWYEDHPEELELISNNLSLLGIQNSRELIERIQNNILLHYYEKLLPITGDPKFYHDFLTERIDGREALEQFREAQAGGKGILCATPHFGAIEFITPYLACNSFPIHALLKFKTEELSAAAHERAETYHKSGNFGPIKFIELGKPGTSAALDMAAVLRRKEMLLTVFDEKTDYSTEVSLFGKRIWGGAGLDKIIAFTRRDIALFAAFMIRLDDNRYRFELKRIDTQAHEPVQQLYYALELVLSTYMDQWYFLHEEIPFIK